MKLILRFEVIPSTDRDEAIELLRLKADRLDCVAIADFNGIDIEAWPGDTYRQVLSRYGQLYNRKTKA